MKKTTLTTVAALTLLFAGCGDKESGNNANGSTANGTSENGEYCQIGTADCSCNASFPCKDDGYFCVEGTCVMCPDGEENCACTEDFSCNAGLTCTNPDPDCTFGCAPWSCQAGGDTCGPQELCDRTRNECMETISETDCLGFYENAAACTDIDAYTACNCECINQPTCQEYFACGSICFNEHCM